MLVIMGADGFIGSVLARASEQARPFRVFVVDRFSTGEKLAQHRQAQFFRNGPDRLLFSWLDPFGARVEGVFHLLQPVIARVQSEPIYSNGWVFEAPQKPGR